ncbi:hypothetical protein RJ639_014440 [Escallonia herrerae]|uniref:C2H2-type domain-containing protein n=1 Tax=Escallonia herrerae TaxID=1293975 RepID=A0AA88VGV5_9ASTE|nr:hypothetical protein RJ639_014440 [Escallonia herrerae]
MERRQCKLCDRSFASGKALGGHMRSHLATLPVPPKVQLGEYHTESSSSLSSAGDEEEEEEEIESEEKVLIYGLRENPKKSFRLVDPQFLDAGSVVQDGESEAESTRNPTRKRSKRARKVGVAAAAAAAAAEEMKKIPQLRKPSSTTESVAELEPVASSVSDASTEEDVALCLMMLSRDVWTSSDECEEVKPREFKCGTCKKAFNSFQALGGHSTSHKKRSVGAAKNVDHQGVHECPFCYRVFGSGQALGGHKRSHLLASSTDATAKVAQLGEGLVQQNKATNFSESILIDLNLPAPVEDEDLSQLEESAVSDAEFINPITISWKVLRTEGHTDRIKEA